MGQLRANGKMLRMKLLLKKENIIVINTCGFIDKAKGSDSMI
jgi:tRNA A37 methylthiotransferase MiaB